MSIILQRNDHVATITLNRPDALNALAPADLAELNRCLTEVRNDDTVRAIIITGAGERSFCTGADIKNTLPPEDSFIQGLFSARGKALQDGNYVRLFNLNALALNKPVIAAINGYCLGGGLEIALQSDIRIASNNARFGLTEPVIGSIPAVGGVPLLIRAIPSSVAMHMLLTGEQISAQRAYEVGLVSMLCTPEDLQASAFELAVKIARNGPLAVKMIKRLADDSANMPLTEAIRLNEVYWGMLRDTEDRIEGRKAFAQKRQPTFRGK